MTPIKCKSFKDKDLDNLDSRISDFMKEEKVSEVVHVLSGQAPRSALTAVTLFYKVEEPKKVRKRQVNEVKEEIKQEVN